MPLVSRSSIERMERPETTLAARAGLRAGYGLSNYVTISDGFAYHGHNGGVEGGLTELAYLPDQSVGYVFFINSGNGSASEKIGKLIHGYLTRDQQKPDLPPAVPLNNASLGPFFGYLEPITPRQEIMRCLERILGVVKLTCANGKLVARPMLGKRKVYLATSDILFREEKEPMATLAPIPLSADGPRMQTSWTMLRPISALAVWLEWGLSALSLALMITAVLFALVGCHESYSVSCRHRA